MTSEYAMRGRKPSCMACCVMEYAPEMVDWLQSYAIPAIKTWYPKMSEALARPDYTPPSTITIKTLNQAAYEATYPASTALAIGADIVFNIANVNVDRSRAVGTFVHEAAHVMQYYDNGTFNGTSIRWIAEGLADYVRYDMYNAYPYNVDYLTQATTAKSHYSEGYAPAANFMRWLSQKYGTNYLKDANVASYKGTYSAQSMQFSDGRNLDEAWALFRNTPTQTGDFKNQSQTTACLDIKDASTRNGALLQVWSCNGSIQQKLTYRPRPDTTVATVMTLGRCMEAANSATANGTTVWSRECNTKPGQDWVHRSDGSLFNPNSNRCLAIANAASGIVNGAGLQIRDCDASPAQRWTIPASK